MSSERLNKLPPYLFAELDRKKRALKEKGADIIDLSIGDPDLPTPKHIIDALCKAVQDPKNHRYPPYNGTQKLRESAAKYLFNSRGIKVNPETEILTLIGSKEGIAHVPVALLNTGDYVLTPSPGYPVYSAATILAGGCVYEMPLKLENNFLPDFKAIPKDILKKAKYLFINYPNNPTSATAEKNFLKEAVDFARENKLFICHDAAYIDIGLDGYKAPSILEINGAKDVAIEFYSLSKTYNMTGWRIGFAAGNPEILSALGKVKTNIDSSATAFVQEAASIALTSSQECVAETCRIYKERREIVETGLQKLGWEVFKSNATFYVWVKAPRVDTASKILEQAHVAITPGEGFGSFGKGYIRFSLSAPTNKIKEAIIKIHTSLGHCCR